MSMNNLIKVKSLSKIELSIIYHLVYPEDKVENLSKKGFLEILNLGGLDLPGDPSWRKDYASWTTTVDHPKFEEFDENNLRLYLQIKWKKTFPFNISIFYKNKELLRKTLFWWFQKETDFNPDTARIPGVNSLNDIQRSLILNDDRTQVRGSTNLRIVNAGPGTGKTTAANALAYSLRSQGVLLISYTNEAVKENYKRFYEFPEGRSSSGFKKYSPNIGINLATVDSLAAHIMGGGSDKEFDNTIQMAAINIDPFKFIHPTRGRIYNHIIVDECQDIDNLRGNFILLFCQKVGIKTLTLFGDPRQKIRMNCGKWYSDLWMNTFDYAKNGHKESKFAPVERVGFEDSYRFENPRVLDLVNDISKRRPGLHVELKGPGSRPAVTGSQSNLAPAEPAGPPPIEVVLLETLMSDGYLNNLLKDYKSACIMGPSIEGDNKTTNVGRRIASLFRANGKKIFFKSEGAFIPDSIPFLTIHSSKGKEFEIVFIFGISDYPNTFSMIPMEEAESLIYVAHSRAIKKICYISGGRGGLSGDEDIGPSPTFILPLHIDKTFVNYNTYQGLISESVGDFERLNTNEMRHFNITNLTTDHTFLRFLEENGYNVTQEEIPTKISGWKIASKPKQISHSSWGFITAYDIQGQLSGYLEVFNFYFGDIIDGNYVVLTMDQIVEKELKGHIINGYTNPGRKRVFNKDPEKKDVDLMYTLQSNYRSGVSTSYIDIIYLYEKYIEGKQTLFQIGEGQFNDIREVLTNKDILDTREQSLVYLGDIKEIISGGQFEISLTDPDFKVLHGRADYMDNDKNVYEFKSSTSATKEYSSVLQSWLYYVLARNETPYCYILDLSMGHLYELTSNQNIYRWRHMIKSYFVLRHHVDLVTSRYNYYLMYGNEVERKRVSEVSIQDNTFCVDTEFYDGKDIFDIALVNVKDPYRSIVELMLPPTLEGMRFALEWLPGTCTEMYDSSMDKMKLKFALSKSKCKETPILAYYVCSVDVDWAKGIPPRVKSIDLSPIARKVTEGCGVFTAGSFGPKLGELYTNLSPFPLEFQNHLKAHTALSDALMLYELIKLGHLRLNRPV